MSLDRPVFVIGTGRAGSTLAFDLLCRHPDLAWYSVVEERLHNTLGGEALHRLGRRLEHTPLRLRGRLSPRPTEPYRLLAAALPGFAQPVRSLEARDLSPWLKRRLEEAFEAKVVAEGASRLMFKYTGWSRVGFMDAAFPDALFLHVHRDGRAVSSSLLQQPWWRGWQGPEQWRWGPLSAEDQETWEASDRSFAVLAALQWRMLFTESVAAMEALPPERARHLSFEDLCADPVGQVRAAIEWAGLEWTEAQDRWVRGKEIRPAAVDKWKRDLSPLQIEEIEGVLADTLAARARLRA